MIIDVTYRKISPYPHIEDLIVFRTFSKAIVSIVIEGHMHTLATVTPRVAEPLLEMLKTFLKSDTLSITVKQPVIDFNTRFFPNITIYRDTEIPFSFSMLNELFRSYTNNDCIIATYDTYKHDPLISLMLNLLCKGRS